MSEPNDDYWFAAKTYGLGWSLPVRWQGWLTLAGYLVLVYLGIAYFGQGRSGLALGIYLAMLTALLVAVVAVKGERPVKWRWGRKRGSDERRP